MVERRRRQTNKLKQANVAHTLLYNKQTANERGEAKRTNVLNVDMAISFLYVKNVKIRKRAKRGKVKIAKTIKQHAFKRFCIFKKVGNIHTKVHAKYENGSF